VPSPLVTCHGLKRCSKKRRAASVGALPTRAAATHVSRHGSRFASAPQLAMNADHASATASSRQPGSSANVAGLNATPGAVGAVAGALLPPGSALAALDPGVDCAGGADAGACVRGATGGGVDDAGADGEDDVEGDVGGAEAGVVVQAAETRKTAVKAKRETRVWILKSGSLIMAPSIPSDL
jgi:hypothetical protein